MGKEAGARFVPHTGEGRNVAIFRNPARKGAERHVDPKAFADRPGRRGACGAAIIEHQAFEDDLEGIGAALGAPLREDAIEELAIPKLDCLIFVSKHTYEPARLATAGTAQLQLGTIGSAQAWT